MVAVTPAPRGNMSAMMVDKSEDMIFYNRDFIKLYHDAPNKKRNTVPGHDYFAKLASFEEEHCEKGELYPEYRKMSCQKKNGELCDNPIPIAANFPTITTNQIRKHLRVAANLMIISLERK